MHLGKRFGKTPPNPLKKGEIYEHVKNGCEKRSTFGGVHP
jgi:hypothetical protein